MHWYGYLLIGLGIPYCGWVGISVIGLQVAIADVRRKQAERDEQCAAHLLAAMRVGEKTIETGEAVARIEGMLTVMMGGSDGG